MSWDVCKASKPQVKSAGKKKTEQTVKREEYRHNKLLKKGCVRMVVKACVAKRETKTLHRLEG